MEAVHGHLSRRDPTAVDAHNSADRERGQRRAVLRATTAVLYSTAGHAEHHGAAAFPIGVSFKFGHLETAAEQAVDVRAKPSPKISKPAARTVTSA